MKFSLVVLSLVVSANVFAYEATQVSVGITLAPFVATGAALGGTTLGLASSSGAFDQKRAVVILDQSQEFIQTGKLPTYLAQQIKNLQTISPELSQEEALDMLIEASENVLN
jgi:hypothetical protein